MNASMLYVDTAIGAATGGAAGVAFGFDKLTWVAAVFALLGAASFVGDKPVSQH